MRFPLLRAVALASCLVGVAACGGPSGPSTPTVALTSPPGGGPAYVAVTGLSNSVLGALTGQSPEALARVLRVAVGADAPAMLGTHAVVDGALRFTPSFPFDAGREYQVRFDGAGLPGWDGGPAPLETTIGLPAVATVPSTVVSQVYPSGDIVPANMLRMYIEFSAPMGRKSGVEYIALLDHEGREIPGAVLPLDYEFWSPDHTRFTVFFDPGRVKKGILPNQQMGRPLESGRTVTLVIDAAWRDAQGLPLKEWHRRQFRVGPADERPLDPATWRVHPPASGGQQPLVVTFPEPLDRGLLMRALGVRANGTAVEGNVAVEQHETRWTFTPTDPWRAGAHQLVAQDILEDLAGNQIGRAFEVDNFDTVDKSPNPETVTIPFIIK
jgi:hypothetical protein